jgi:hypothetical protein
LRSLRPPLRHPPGSNGPLRAVTAKFIEAMGEIDVGAAEAALAQHGGDLSGGPAGALRRRIDDHAGQPRRQRQTPQLLSLVGDPAGFVDRS